MLVSSGRVLDVLPVRPHMPADPRLTRIIAQKEATLVIGSSKPPIMLFAKPCAVHPTPKSPSNISVPYVARQPAAQVCCNALACTDT